MRKITRIVATRCQIFGVKMYKIRFRLELCPRPHNPIWAVYSSPPPDPLAAFKAGLKVSWVSPGLRPGSLYSLPGIRRVCSFQRHRG